MSKNVIVLFFVLLLISCGGDEKVQELSNAMKAVQNADETAEKMNESNDLIQKRMDERKQKGDTLAMHYKKLQEYLPASISGYTAEAPTGESINMPGASYSNAHIRFTKGNDEVTVNIIDYNQAFAMYQGVIALWSMGMSVDNDRETAKGYNPNLELSGGWEKYDKQNKAAELLLGIGSRFFIEIKASNQTNTDFVKSVANSMKLAEMSKM